MVVRRRENARMNNSYIVTLAMRRDSLNDGIWYLMSFCLVKVIIENFSGKDILKINFTNFSGTDYIRM